MNKSYGDLKMKQKDKIANWCYQEYKAYVDRTGKLPDKFGDIDIVDAVYRRIESAQIWIPEYEIDEYYHSRKTRLQKRYEKENNIQNEIHST